ncbi:DUF2568 domain-containing protein [Segetibacter koreensis]
MGFQKGNSALIKYFLAIMLPILVISLWSYFRRTKIVSPFRPALFNYI